MVSVVLNCTMYYVVLYCTDLEDGEEEDEDCWRTAAVIGFVEENLKSRQQFARVGGVLVVVVQPLIIPLEIILNSFLFKKNLHLSSRPGWNPLCPNPSKL